MAENNSILSEPEPSLVGGNVTVKNTVDELAEEDSPEARDEILSIAKGHGIDVTPEMTTTEIQDKVHDVL